MSLDNFDPNSKKKPVTPEYATYLPYRNPQFKIHKTIGHARAALSYKWPVEAGILYVYKNNEWVELERSDILTNCSLCRISFSAVIKENRWPITSWNWGGRPDIIVSPIYKNKTYCKKCWSIR